MLAMQEWMTVIDAAIQGVPEEAQRRRKTVSHHYSLHARSAHSRVARLSSNSAVDDFQDAIDESGRALTSSQSMAEFGAAGYHVDGS